MLRSEDYKEIRHFLWDGILKVSSEMDAIHEYPRDIIGLRPKCCLKVLVSGNHSTFRWFMALLVQQTIWLHAVNWAAITGVGSKHSQNDNAMTLVPATGVVEHLFLLRL
jgi:hypothetical protein